MQRFAVYGIFSFQTNSREGAAHESFELQLFRLPLAHVWLFELISASTKKRASLPCSGFLVSRRATQRLIAPCCLLLTACSPRKREKGAVRNWRCWAHRPAGREQTLFLSHSSQRHWTRRQARNYCSWLLKCLARVGVGSKEVCVCVSMRLSVCARVCVCCLEIPVRRSLSSLAAWLYGLSTALVTLSRLLFIGPSCQSHRHHLDHLFLYCPPFECRRQHPHSASPTCPLLSLWLLPPCHSITSSWGVGDNHNSRRSTSSAVSFTTPLFVASSTHPA